MPFCLSVLVRGGRGWISRIKYHRRPFLVEAYWVCKEKGPADWINAMKHQQTDVNAVRACKTRTYSVLEKKIQPRRIVGGAVEC